MLRGPRTQHLEPLFGKRSATFPSEIATGRRPPSRPISRRRISARAIKEEIYYATFPLVGLESLERAMVLSGREIPDILAQHCAIIVSRPSEERCMLYDFLPEEPTAPATAASLLSGRSVKGVVRQRAMRRVPTKRCKWIGTAVVKNAMKQAEDFNTSWDRSLSLFKNDCRNHSAQLAKILLDDPSWEVSPP